MNELYTIIFILKSRLNPKQIAERKHAANVRWGHEQADPKRATAAKLAAPAKLSNPIEKAIAKILPAVSIIPLGDEGFLLTDGELYQVPHNSGHGDIAKMALESLGGIHNAEDSFGAVNKVMEVGAIRIATGEYGRNEFSFELINKPTAQQLKTLMEMSQAYEHVSGTRLKYDADHGFYQAFQLLDQPNPRRAIPSFLASHFKSFAASEVFT